MHNLCVKILQSFKINMVSNIKSNFTVNNMQLLPVINMQAGTRKTRLRTIETPNRLSRLLDRCREFRLEDLHKIQIANVHRNIHASITSHRMVKG